MFNPFNKKKDDQKIIAIAIITVIAIAIFAIFIYSFNKDGLGKGRKNETAQQEKIKSEEESLIDSNKEALDKVSAQAQKEVRGIDKNDHTIGELSAPVKIIVYSDFECPFCADFSNTVKTIAKDFGDKVVIAYRHFHLMTSHVNALAAAIASECAAEQGKFWEMHDKLFEDNIANRMSSAQFKKAAKELSLNLAKFNKCLDTEKYKDKVINDMMEARSAGVLGTPHTFLNGQALPGAYQYEDFKDSGGYDRKGMKTIINENLEKLGE